MPVKRGRGVLRVLNLLKKNIHKVTQIVPGKRSLMLINLTFD